MIGRQTIIILTVLCGMASASCTKRADRTVQALYEQGRMLREQGEPVQAMEVFLRAAHSDTKDEKLIGRVYSNMANMCRLANDHETAFRVYALSAEHFAASGDTLAYAYALNNMAWEQAAMKHKDSASWLVRSAIFAYPLPPLTDKIIETRAAACFFMQEYDSVLCYTTSPANDYLLMLRAQAYSFLQKDDSAAYYARLLLPRTSNPFYLDDLYYILTHNDTAADKETVLALSAERADIQKQICERHGQLTQAVQVLRRDLDSGFHPMPLMAYVLLTFVALGLCVWTLMIRRKRNKLHWAQTKFEQERRNELIQAVRVLLDAPNLKQELCWDDFDALCRQTDKRFQGLATKLLLQHLTEQDIRICILVLLGLSHKETADMLNCSAKSIGKLKDLTARKLHTSGGHLRETLITL